MLRALLFGFTALYLTACGPNEKLNLKAVDVSTTQGGGRTYVNLKAVLLMGNLRFPNIEVPVYNPSTNQPIGSMGLSQLSDGSNQVTVSVDYTEASKLDTALGRTLPNGREIPNSLGAYNTPLVGIPALEQSRIYVGGDTAKELFIGVAVAIPAFDNVTSEVPIPLNIFYTYPFSADVFGVAGLFTGPQKGQNGVAVFARKTMKAKTVPFAEEDSIQLAMSNKNNDETLYRQPATSDSELEKLDDVTRFKLDRLFKKRATVKVK